MYLVDSNIIIYHFNNNKIATTFLQNNLDYCSISQITYVEVLSFNFQTKEEMEQAKDLLYCFKIYDVNNQASEQAIVNRKSTRIKLPDNIIASTAQVNNLTLVTRNVKDFEMLDISLLNPFNEDI